RHFRKDVKFINIISAKAAMHGTANFIRAAGGRTPGRPPARAHLLDSTITSGRGRIVVAHLSAAAPGTSHPGPVCKVRECLSSATTCRPARSGEDLNLTG